MTTNLGFMALCWLRFEKRCPYALFERSPRYGLGLPDVLGVTASGHLLEIEIKRSLSDFRADAKKPHRILLTKDVNNPRWPKNIWYLVPPELLKKVEKELPAWAGLLRGPGRNEIQSVYSVVKAPNNPNSRKLDFKEMLSLGHCMANQIYVLTSRIDQWRYSNESDYGIEYRI